MRELNGLTLEGAVGIKLSHFYNLFVRYGAGTGIFTPITKLKCWNVIAWVSIVAGIAGWIVFLYFFPLN